MFQSIYTTIISNIQKSLGKDSGWITDSVVDHTISISKYNTFGSSHIILNHTRKGLSNIQNIDDNECLKWRLVKYSHPVDHNPRRTTKADKDFTKMLKFKNIKLPVKIRQFTKLKKRIPLALVFLVMKISKTC